MKTLKSIFSKIIQELDAYLECLIFTLPGMLGGKCRLWWCKAKMGNFGLGCGIGNGVKFIEPKNMKLGNACYVGIRSFFTADGGEIIIGDDTSFNTNVHINASGGGIIKIGNSVLIAPNVVMRTSGHRFDDLNISIRKQGYIVKNITIEDDVWIGSNAVIVGGVVIGRGAVVGAGAVVTKDIPPMTIAVGIPARVIKNRKN